MVIPHIVLYIVFSQRPIGSDAGYQALTLILSVQKGDRLLKKARDIRIPLVSVIRIKPAQKVAPDVKQ
jgi:hypothetical protein